MGAQQALQNALTAPTRLVAWDAGRRLAERSRRGRPEFWTALVFSPTMGLIAASPVNLLLVHVGVEEGMTNSAKTGTEMGT